MQTFFRTLLLSLAISCLFAASKGDDGGELTLTVNGGDHQVALGDTVPGTASYSGCSPGGYNVKVTITNSAGAIVYDQRKASPHAFSFVTSTVDASAGTLTYTVVASCDGAKETASVKVALFTAELKEDAYTVCTGEAVSPALAITNQGGEALEAAWALTGDSGLLTIGTTDGTVSVPANSTVTVPLSATSQPGSAGIDKLTATVTAQGGSVSDSTTATVVKVATQAASKTELCAGEIIQFTATPEPEGAAWPTDQPEWEFRPKGGEWARLGRGPAIEVADVKPGVYEVRARCGASDPGPAPITATVYAGLKGLKTDAQEYEPFSTGDTVVVTPSYDGPSELIPPTTFQLYDIEKKQVVEKVQSKEATITLLVPEAGRYLVKATTCEDHSPVDSTVFVKWEMAIAPADLRFNFDLDLGQVVAPDFEAVDILGDAIDGLAQTVVGYEAKDALEKFKDKHLNATQAAIDEMEGAIAKAQSDLPSTKTDLGATNTELKGVESELQSETKTRDKITKELNKNERLLGQKKAEISRLQTQMENAKSITKQQEIQKKIKDAQKIADQYSDTITKTKTALNNAIVRVNALAVKVANLGAKVERLKSAIEGLKVQIQSLKDARKQIQNSLKNASLKLLGKALIALDLYSAGEAVAAAISASEEYDSRLEAINANAERMKVLSEIYKEKIDAIVQNEARRKVAPLTTNFAVATKPGLVPFELKEVGVSWRTQDEDIPKSESAWGFKHLVLVNGLEGMYNTPIYTASGSTGGKELTAHVYGNLGSSKLIAKVEGVTGNSSVNVLVDGLDEVEAIAMVESRFYSEYQRAEEWKAALEKWQKWVAGLAGAITLGAFALAAAKIIAVGTAVAISSVAGAIVLAIGLVSVLAISLIGYASPLVDSIKYFYPVPQS
ncbi:MAG: hypothetical protein PF961_23290 [Planctomycetota bacterium]|jgi:hypothetical protein|nr:hypothetical protein [Planctomycetota bacterium]